MSEKIIAKLKFLGMEKLIEILPGTMNYKIALPVHADVAPITEIQEETIAEQAQYVSLVFIAENNPRYGLSGEPELCFIFDHTNIEGVSERGDRQQTNEKVEEPDESNRTLSINTINEFKKRLQLDAFELQLLMHYIRIPLETLKRRYSRAISDMGRLLIKTAIEYKGKVMGNDN